MSNITEEELVKLSETKCNNDWSEVCDDIKSAHGGEYPSDWFAKVMLGGVAAAARARWGCGCGKKGC